MKKNSFYLPALILFNFSMVTSTAYAIDWNLSYGVHDFIVPDAAPLEAAPNGDDSHTYGVDVGFYAEHTTPSDILLRGSYTIYFDYDQDELDPDHLPVWFMFNFNAKGRLYQNDRHIVSDWLIDINAKRNTVSSIEKQFKFYPGIRAAYETEKFDLGIKLSIGQYALEIDDDVPKMRGYERRDMNMYTEARSVMIDTRIAFGKSTTLTATAQSWNSIDEWLENQYRLSLEYDSNGWIKDSVFTVSFERTVYNLDNFAYMDTNDPAYVPILPWDEDMLIRAYIIVPWN